MFVCMFDFILYVPANSFQLYQDGSSWFEPVLSKVKCFLLKDTCGVSVRLEPLVKLSTTEPLHSPYNR